jgi:hypothetical protein
VALALTPHEMVRQPPQVGRYEREKLTFSLATPLPPQV